LAGIGGRYDYSYQVNSVADAANLITHLAQSGVNIDQLIIAGHGQPATQYLGRERISADVCPQDEEALQNIGAGMSPNGVVELWGCNVANSSEPGSNSQRYLESIANAANRPVVAYTGRTWMIPVIWLPANFGERIITMPK